MQVPRAQESDNGRKRRPLEGFLRGRTRRDGQSSGEQQSEEQPFGFYRPDPEAEERDRIARRLLRQVFG